MNLSIEDFSINFDYIAYSTIYGIESSKACKNFVIALSIVNYSNVLANANTRLFKAPYLYFSSTKVKMLPKDNYYVYKYKDEKTDLVHEIFLYNNKQAAYNYRNSYHIFWYNHSGTDEESKQNFFNELARNVDIPILESWKDYLWEFPHGNTWTNTYYDRDVSARRLLTVRNARFSKQELIEYISKGLADSKIKIDENNNTVTDKINSVTGLDSYLNNYSEILADKIQNSYVPCFTPGKDVYNKRLKDFDDSCYFGGMDLFYAQKCTMQATINTLKTKKSAFIIGEQGSGKTIMSLGVCYASRTHDGFNAVIMCPSHLVNKWQREIERYVPNGKAYIIKNVNDVIRLNPILRDKKKHDNVFMIMSKETAKLDNELRPNVVYSRSKKAFICPHCGEILRSATHYDNYEYNNKPKMTDEDFYKESAKNQECLKCHTKLWTPISANNDKWIKLGSNGWVNENRISVLHTTLSGNTKRSKSDANMLYAIEKYQEDQSEFSQPKYSRYPIAKYIRKYYKGYIDFVIGDELHLYNGDSAQGDAFGQLTSVATKVIGLTGTLLNGYADSLFYLLFRTIPGTMIKEGFYYNSKDAFNKAYGVIKNTYTDEIDGYRTLTRKTTKKLPGVSPLVFTKFLLENAVFVNLSDMLDGLPNYTEYPIKVTMSDELANNYSDAQDKISEAFSKNKKLIGSITKTLSAYPDYPYDFEPVVDPDTNKVIVKPNDISDRNALLPKEQELLNIVEQKHANNEKVLVYYSWTNIIDLDVRLKKILEDHGYHTEVLKASVSAQNREQWIREHTEEADVLLCNPSLVETGLDLLDYTTIVFYEIGYNLFTMRQSSRRSWRLGQTRPISVYYLYYEDTIQEQALSLMASKLQASMAIEGKFSEDGLQALSENEDLLTQIANSIVSGIKYKVNDNCFKQIVTDTYHQQNTSETQAIASNHNDFGDFGDLIDDSVDDVESTEQPVIDIDDNAIVQNIIKEPKKIFRRTKYEIEGKHYDLCYWQKDKINVNNPIAKIINSKENIEELCDCVV